MTRRERFGQSRTMMLLGFSRYGSGPLEVDDLEVTPPRGLIRAEATLHFWLIRFGRGRQGHHLHFGR